MQNTSHPNPGSLLSSPVGLVLCGLLEIGALYLTITYTTHVVGLLPYGLLLLCPIMHLFMHRSHGGHEKHTNDGDQKEKRFDNA